ncbi:MAG: hypothetical protein GX786_03825 [Clostridiales bacterium]|nr:hypothetical protein [Clostridiales bacterium]
MRGTLLEEPRHTYFDKEEEAGFGKERAVVNGIHKEQEGPAENMAVAACKKDSDMVEMGFVVEAGHP